MEKVDILTVGVLPGDTATKLDRLFRSHRAMTDAEVDAAIAANGDRIRAIARGAHVPVGAELMSRLPRLEIVASFGVGYDGTDVDHAATHGIVVTNTPDVLTEEVADTTIGLLLMTVRELSAAERHLRAGLWPKRSYPLTRATLRNRTVGIAGLGRIGLAVARRLDAMGIPVVYHTRKPRREVAYRHYPDLTAMAKDVDVLIVVLPGSDATRNLVDRRVLEALGPDGILINIGRGSVVDEPALIEALASRRIFAAGLDVFADEPNVPDALIALDNVVLLPHVGSASVATRDAMGQLVVDNLASWFGEGRPLTPVPETPWRPKTA